MEKIYELIRSAHIVVADMTGQNANVFYEVGYAHAIGKEVILLTQKAEDIPANLKNYKHIVYGGSISALKDQLKHLMEAIYLGRS
jgi:nucleoside 2-deoxyribosyltransferase